MCGSTYRLAIILNNKIQDAGGSIVVVVVVVYKVTVQ